MNWFKRHWYIPAIVVLVIGVAVWVQLTKDSNWVASWVFDFVNGWATTLMAAATVGLAIATICMIAHSGRQTKMIAEQRRKSIEPHLQIDDITPIWNRVNVLRIESPVPVKDNTTQETSFRPELTITLSNIGSGAATGLVMSADAVIVFVNEDTEDRIACDLHFGLLRLASDQYIQHTVDEPRNFKLTLRSVDQLESTRNAGSVEVDLSFNDADGHHFTESRLYELPKNRHEIVVDTKNIVIGDHNFLVA